MTKIKKFLLPSKHIKLSQSILGLSSLVVHSLDRPKAIDELWKDLRQDKVFSSYTKNHSIDNIFLALDFLFALNRVEIKDNLIKLKDDDSN